MPIPRTTLAILLLLFVAAPASAAITKEDDTLMVVDRADLPQRGVSAAKVLARHGDPMARRAPVGDPPITRWDYPEYSVFFEYDLVLHSVVIRNGVTAPAE